MRRIKKVFEDKLQLVWLPKSQWKVGAITTPLLQDAYIDYTVVKEQVIHKIVEVKVQPKNSIPLAKEKDELDDRELVGIPRDQVAQVKADAKLVEKVYE